MNRLTVRVSVVTASLIFVLLVLFAISAWVGARQLASNKRAIEDAYRNVFTSTLKLRPGGFDETVVRRRAREVEKDVLKYLMSKYGSLAAVPPTRELEFDAGLRTVALQFVLDKPPENLNVVDADDKRIGYTVVYARDFTMTTHTQERLVGKNVRALSQQPELYLFWWDIFGKAVWENAEKAGFYLWPEANDTVAIKYMVCRPIEGTQLMVAATAYPKFDHEEEIVASARTVAKALFEMERSTKNQMSSMIVGAIVLTTIGLVIIVLITQREALRVSADRDQLERFWRTTRIDSLVKVFAHGIRNDLFLIRSRAEYLRQEAMEGSFESSRAEAVQDLNNIVERADRIQRQTDLAIADKRDAAHKKQINPVEILKTVIDGHPSDQFAIGLDLTRLKDQEPIVEGIEQELKSVFENLVINARQVAGGRGTLQIEVVKRRRGGHKFIHMIFRDKGPGFSNPKRAAELGWTTRAAAGGTGTGLAIVDRIMFHHEGHLTLRNSARKGWGAVVEISLPLADIRSKKGIVRRMIHVFLMRQGPAGGG